MSGDKAVRVRFRYESASAVLALPSALRETGALALGKTFQWPALVKALGFPRGSDSFNFDVVGVGTEGNPLGTGELVIHVD